MKIVFCILAVFPVLVLCPSCNKDIENFREEIKVLKDENNFLKAENIALKKEIEELYKRIEEKDLSKQKPETKSNEENVLKESAVKKPDNTETDKQKKPTKAEQDKIKQPVNGKNNH